MTFSYQSRLKHLPIAAIILVFLAGCDQPARERMAGPTKDVSFTESCSIPQGQVIYRYYDSGQPEEIYMVNDLKDRHGYSFHYYESGALVKLSKWKNGAKEGYELIFGRSGRIEEINSYQNGRLHGDILSFEDLIPSETHTRLRSHRLFMEGIKVYEALYQGGEKHLNRLYPHFLEEFFFEDKYYAKIKFPLDYPGQMEVRVNDPGNATASDLSDHTFQLVINDALDLNEYTLELNYQPAGQDSLIAFSYVYPHRIYATN